jgi:hypothetical protein
MKAAMATSASGLDPAVYCKTVVLECGGQQPTSFGLGPGERKGDYARSRMLAAKEAGA